MPTQKEEKKTGAREYRREYHKGFVASGTGEDLISITMISNSRVYGKFDRRVPNRLMISPESRHPVAFPAMDGMRCAEETAFEARSVMRK